MLIPNPLPRPKEIFPAGLHCACGELGEAGVTGRAYTGRAGPDADQAITGDAVPMFIIPLNDI